MTGLMHEKEFSRKTFLKGGGALIIGFSALGALGAGKAAGRDRQHAVRRPHPCRLPAEPADDRLVDRDHPDNTVIVTHGEPEFGHGTPTGILMLVAEELNTNMSQMIYARPESWLNSTGGGGGSGGISQRSTQIRAAAAYAKQQLLNMASTQLGIPAASLTVSAASSPAAARPSATAS